MIPIQRKITVIAIDACGSAAKCAIAACVLNGRVNYGNAAHPNATDPGRMYVLKPNKTDDYKTVVPAATEDVYDAATALRDIHLKMTLPPMGQGMDALAGILRAEVGWRGSDFVIVEEAQNVTFIPSEEVQTATKSLMKAKGSKR
jgi:hypothetical protein